MRIPKAGKLLLGGIIVILLSVLVLTQTGGFCHAQKPDITEMADNHDETKLLESKIDSLNMLVATFRAFANARIDIKNINQGAIARNTPCKVSIVDVEGIYDQKKGLFKIEGESAKIEGDQLTGTKKGTVDLVYIYDGVEIKRLPVKIN